MTPPDPTFATRETLLADLRRVTALLQARAVAARIGAPPPTIAADGSVRVTLKIGDLA